jgi:hypothetical protein
MQASMHGHKKYENMLPEEKHNSPVTDSKKMKFYKLPDNFRPATLKLVQERAGTTLEVIGIGKDSSVEPQQLSN